MVTIVHDLSQYQHVPSVVFFGRLTSQGLESLNILTPVRSKYWGFDLCSSFKHSDSSLFQILGIRPL